MKQRLSIDLEFTIDSRPAAQTDSLKDAIDYATVAAAVAETCASRDFHLIETVAEKIAQRVLADFATARVRVLVRKISPIVQPKVSYVSIEIVRP